MLLLLATVSGFADKSKVYLTSRARIPLPLIEVYIDGKTLEFDLSEDLGALDISIEDGSGNVVFNSFIEGDNGVIPLELDLEKGNYVLVITNEKYILWGDFSVE